MGHHWPPPRPPARTHHTRRQSPTQQDDEAHFLDSLASHPQHIPAVTRRLHPDDLTNPRHQLLYRSLAALHHCSEPIDPLTLAWEARHHGAPAHHLTIDHITTPTTDDPHQRDDRLLQAAFQRAASDVAHAIKALTADSTFPEGALIAAMELAFQPLIQLHHRWRTPSRPVQQLRAGPTVSERGMRGQAA
ncbi:DnaB-like helicase N-terminal domain-containing protein [Streptomyces sp. DSM 44915]|uniref:DnaB-like helicase N-terminal domain-containing protein n=1 Tax=Streptomyces chisholmiae TaxID=3075540 RepID=A0ABU2JNJ0_9ACTN|nr:DnaB-like helicase N-terminal domain-containing protein [Streptomyces sp. DSM 44915]MDT0266560.1 DnaB-like helicase N-terminal domain-containing protein [Streptomyces sp. DSM 44915]